MPLEIEQKFPIDDAAAVVERIENLMPAVESLGQTEQVDTYYNHPARDFRALGEALRIRRTDNGAVVTYKGPKLDTVVKTRRETELPLTLPDEWGDLLLTLGFTEVAKVSKVRQRYLVHRAPFALEIVVDHVQELGTFVEVEIVTDEMHADEARETIVAMAAELQLGEPERRSYLSMLMAARG